MRKNLSRHYNKEASQQHPALDAYFSVLEERKTSKNSLRDQHLDRLAAFIPTLSDINSLSAKDIKCFYMLYIKLLCERGTSQDHQTALECSQHALNFDRDDMKSIAKHAQLLHLNKQSVEALMLYHEGLQQHPKDKDLLTGLGRLYVDGGKFDMALNCFHNVLVTAPRDQSVKKLIQEINILKRRSSLDTGDGNPHIAPT